MAWPFNTYAPTLVVILGLLRCGTASAPDPFSTSMPASTPTPWPSITSEPRVFSSQPAVLSQTSGGTPSPVRKVPAVATPEAEALKLSTAAPVLSEGAKSSSPPPAAGPTATPTHALDASPAAQDTPAPEPPSQPEKTSPAPTPQVEAAPPAVASGDHADVIGISVSGEPGSYRFSVTVRSPDTGCDRYADLWEVVSPGGQLIYRRVLLHSHSGEQPFTRSGGPVNIQPDETVIVRGHMNVMGYGGAGLKGSVTGGFAPMETPGEFGAGLDRQAPCRPDAPIDRAASQ
jgi:hypothetical protein